MGGNCPRCGYACRNAAIRREIRRQAYAITCLRCGHTRHIPHRIAVLTAAHRPGGRDHLFGMWIRQEAWRRRVAPAKAIR